MVVLCTARVTDVPGLYFLGLSWQYTRAIGQPLSGSFPPTARGDELWQGIGQHLDTSSRQRGGDREPRDDGSHKAKENRRD